MRKKQTGGINVGTSSILVTFVLLCLVTFAALSFLSANSDYRLSKQAAERTTRFYAADALAEEKLADIESRLKEVLASVSSEDDYYDGIPSAFEGDESLQVNSEDITTISYEIPVSDSQNLQVLLSVKYPAGDDAALFDILKWQTMSADIWEESDSGTVMLDDGDISFMTFD